MEPMSAPPAQSDRSTLAIISLVLGVLGLCAWLFPLCGIPITVVGAVLGGLSLKSQRRGMAIAGLILCGVALLLALCNAAFGAYMGLSGQFNPQDFFNNLQ